MQNLRFLVTGAAGFLGTRLCERLLSEGIEVHATSRARQTSRNHLLRWWQTDLLEYSSVQRLFDEIRPDIVIHLAGQVTAAPDLSLVLPMFHSQLGGTLNVLVASTKSGCRRVIATGSSTEPALDDAAPTPGSPYAAAKWAATGYAGMFHALYQTPVVVVRPFMTYGPGQHGTKVVPYVINSLLQGNTPLLSSCVWEVDWVFVDDIVAAFLLAATRAGIDGCSIDLGSGTLTSIRDVVRSIVQLTNAQIDPQFGALPDRPGQRTRIADTEYARATLGWSAVTSLDDGLAATVQWYRSQLEENREVEAPGHSYATERVAGTQEVRLLGRGACS
ncbi:NAD-dependent epimerase/dehydratase family protein [Nordella sp. HKS 07]|uniref:NAD-dependent epimerase/dehydratase family protein n=1 Tax=Nordella sp. HKS 07 TaxID=2712222 RepID=UPI0013E13E57|nr:NAD-dependent epimerase/dehydratase family protein [Nordella sp. HKS 07]QIG51840.1 NAD-dependent epimerase/dehydratase family protein [Nordella sp. HKS 07]